MADAKMKFVTVVVCDSNGNGLQGHRVKAYGGDEVRTGKDGMAMLAIPIGGETSIYVDGRSVWSGFKSAIPAQIVHRK